MSMLDYHRPRSRERLLMGIHVAWIENSERRNYIRQCVLSFPSWVDTIGLAELKKRVRELTLTTGVVHNADHIIPLTHPLVCGLTVPLNLRAVPQSVNLSKGNYWNPHQLSLFKEGEEVF